MADEQLIEGSIIKFELQPYDSDTGLPISMSGVSSATIAYTKDNPSTGLRVNGTWTATIVGDDVVYTTTQADTLGFYGNLTLQVTIVKNGNPIIAKPIYETIHKRV